MSNILSNIAALKSLYHLNRNQEGYATSMERISSGKRINAAGDDAAGASIVNRMTSQISGMQIAIRNAGDAISMAQTAEGAMNECSEILHRMRELAVQSANGTYSGADRVALNAEVVELKNELLRISETTKFNDVKLINGSFTDTTFEIGYDESPGHSHTLSIESVKPTDLGMWTTTTQLSKSVTVTAVDAWATTSAADITVGTSHLFNVGDLVTYESVSDPATGKIPGLQSGATYKISQKTDTTFRITDLDGSNISLGSSDHHGTGVGAKFHLASLAGAPTPQEAGDTTKLSSEVINTEDITIHGHVGSTKVHVASESTAKALAEAISNTESLTGVKATAQTNARLTVTPDDNSNDYHVVSFSLSGMNTEIPKIISASIKIGTGDGTTSADLSDLRDKINGFSGSTGIQASLSPDKTYIDLKSPDGYDILIEDVDFPADTKTAVKTVDVTAGNVATSGTITAAAHGLQDGDLVRVRNIPAATENLTNITTDTVYTVRDAASGTFKLTTGLTTNAVITPGVDNDGTISFERIEKSLNVQSMNRSKVLQGTPIKLADKDLGNDETQPVAVDSARITGEVQYESSQVFTLVPDVKDSLFRDAPPAASLQKVSDMDVLTVANSHAMLTSIDGALKRVDAERGDLGATMNRMGHTIDNLGNIVVNSSAARSRIEDADMALETAELAKTQILQQAATAMVGQANKAMQTILSLLR
jgi:flagellin